MSAEADQQDAGNGSGERETEDKAVRTGPLLLIRRTLSKAWESAIFSESAEAAFWQTLSLPPLLLGLLGSLGFIGDWFGPEVVGAVHDRIITFAEKVFSGGVVNQIIEPTVDDILTIGKGEIVSVGFLISLWAGSSAMSSFVDAITVAHDQYGVRNEVWQRIFALLLYLVLLVFLVVGLPIIAIGPNVLIDLFPLDWHATVALWVGTLYYPVLAVAIALALTTLYKLALPRKLPWHRGLPGAVLAMAIFLLTSIGLRIYLGWITSTGYTYGALATPIAFLLFTFFIGMAVVGGAYFNSAIQELWPAKKTRRQRRKWRRLEMDRASGGTGSPGAKSLWQRITRPLRPLRKPRGDAESRTPRTSGEEPDTASLDSQDPTSQDAGNLAAGQRNANSGESSQSLADTSPPSASDPVDDEPGPSGPRADRASPSRPSRGPVSGEVSS